MPPVQVLSLLALASVALSGPAALRGAAGDWPRKTSTWTPKVCRIIAFYRLRAFILPTFGGLGKPNHFNRVVLKCYYK